MKTKSFIRATFPDGSVSRANRCILDDGREVMVSNLHIQKGRHHQIVYSSGQKLLYNPYNGRVYPFFTE